MRVALIGAPNSGKSDTAMALVSRLADDVAGVTIIDDYVDHLSDHTNVAYGHFAGYVSNLMAALKRLEEEQHVILSENLNADVIITCGTVIETILYCELHGLVVQSLPSIDDRQAEAIRMNDTVRPLIMLLYDYWMYDHVFYLPYEGDFDSTTWNAKLDEQIPNALNSFFIQFVTLHGSPEEKAAKIHEHIKYDIKKAKSPETSEGEPSATVGRSV